jgi:hypothetical protein
VPGSGRGTTSLTRLRVRTPDRHAAAPSAARRRPTAQPDAVRTSSRTRCPRGSPVASRAAAEPPQRHATDAATAIAQRSAFDAPSVSADACLAGSGTQDHSHDTASLLENSAMLSALMRGGGLINLVGGLIGGRAQAANGDRQGMGSSIGSLIGLGLGTCFGGVGARIGSGIGGLIGRFFDKQASSKHIAQARLLAVGQSVASDERMRLHASNGDIARLIDHLKMYREQELLSAGVRGHDIDGLYRNLREYDRQLDDFASIVCSLAQSQQVSGPESGSAAGFVARSASRLDDPPIRFGNDPSHSRASAQGQ